MVKWWFYAQTRSLICVYDEITKPNTGTLWLNDCGQNTSSIQDARLYMVLLFQSSRTYLQYTVHQCFYFIWKVRYQLWTECYIIYHSLIIGLMLCKQCTRQMSPLLQVQNVEKTLSFGIWKTNKPIPSY